MGGLLIVLLAGLLAAFVPSVVRAESVAAHGPALRVGMTQEIDSLNPFLGSTLAATDLFRAIYPTLSTYRPANFSVAGELAESWDTSADRLTWTFHIRPRLRWSDGVPVTAGDAAYTFNRILTDPAAATANGNFVENFASVDAPDDRTLVIRTRSPQATMLALDVPIVPEHVWSGVADIASFANDRMPIVGYGPFVLTDYQPEQHVILQANKQFWRGPPKVDTVRFVSFHNSDAAVQALRKGDIDVVQKLTPTQFDALAGPPSIRQVRGQGRRFSEIVLNPGATNSANVPIGTGHPALADIRVRTAVDQAIDRQALVRRVLGGYGQGGDGYLPPIFGDYHFSPARQRPFDPAAANRALDQAGYRRGPDGIRRTPRGQPLHFRFLLHGDEADDAMVGEFVRRWLADIGIDVELQSLSDNLLNERTTAGDFDMAIGGWSVTPDPDYVLRLQTCAARPTPQGDGTPDTFLCDPRYDALYRDQRAEFDPAARSDLVKQAEQRFYDDATGLILFYPNSLEAYRSDRFSGFLTQPGTAGVITAQQGYWGYWGAQPTADAGRRPGTDYRTVAWGVGGIAALFGLIVVLIVLRRRATIDDRE